MESFSRLFTFSDYLSQLYARLWASDNNASVAAENRPSLDCLPDDILLIILDQLEQLDAENAFQLGFLTHELSDLVQFSTVNKRVRGLAKARVLKKLHLGPSWSAKKIFQALSQIRHCESARRYTKVLKVDLWLEGLACVQTDCPNLMNELLETISILDNVRTLGITATESSALALQSAFEDGTTRLEGITGLILPPHMDWLIPKCPNLLAVSTNDWVVMARDKHSQSTRLIEAVACITDLQHFALHSPWYTDTLQDALAALPNIRSLGMLSGTCTANLEDRLPILRKFRRLERLEMTDASRLTRVQTWQGDNMTLPCVGSRKETLTPAQAHVTQRVFQALPQLQELILGPAFRAWVKCRHADGRVDLKWEATIVRPPLFQSLRYGNNSGCGFDNGCYDTTAVEQADEPAAERWSLADTLNSLADAQTLDDHNLDEDEAEQLRLLQAEMAM